MKLTEEQMKEALETTGYAVTPEFIQDAAAVFSGNITWEYIRAAVIHSIEKNGKEITKEQLLRDVRNEMEQKNMGNEKMKRPGDTRRITREYFDSLLIEQRVMGTGLPDTSVSLFGHRFAAPVMTAALSHLGPSRYGLGTGMKEYAMGAKLSGTLHWVGMCDDSEFRDIMSVGAETIRIIKPYRDEGKIFAQIDCAKDTGAVAVGMDIDHIFTRIGGIDVVKGEEMEIKTKEQFMAYKEAGGLPFVIKGVLSVHDAVKATEAGADAVVVSHHGGKMDYAVPPLLVLPDIAAAVKGKVKIFVDCGIMSGMDAYKALALGADAVGVGPHLMALKEGGADAIAARLKEITAELAGVMAYTGVADTGSFDPTVIHRI